MLEICMMGYHESPPFPTSGNEDHSVHFIDIIIESELGLVLGLPCSIFQNILESDTKLVNIVDMTGGRGLYFS